LWSVYGHKTVTRKLSVSLQCVLLRYGDRLQVVDTEKHKATATT
jgi:hypothetical protein